MADSPPDPCPHASLSGDEGPVRELPGGLETIVRWRCDECGAVQYDDAGLAALRALLGHEDLAHILRYYVDDLADVDTPDHVRRRQFALRLLGSCVHGYIPNDHHWHHCREGGDRHQAV